MASSIISGGLLIRMAMLSMYFFKQSVMVLRQSVSSSG